MQDANLIESRDWVSNERFRNVPDLKMIPVSDRYGYREHKFSDEEKLKSATADKAIYFYDTKPYGGQILYIGHLQFKDYNGQHVASNNPVQVSEVLLDYRYNERDLGLTMYITALQLGYSIIADRTQTAQSAKLWFKLNQNPKVQVRGIIKLMRNDVDTRFAKRTTLRDIEGNKNKLARLGASALVPMESLDQFDFVPYEFPVQLGRENAETILKATNFYISKRPRDLNEFVTIYAIWI